jgi:uncharacterized protein YfaS (alpha-2-macroglobulin family)
VKNGEYSGSFTLTDLITKFRFSVDAVSREGVYGMLQSSFNSNKPFYVESKVPFFFTNQDQLHVPIVIHNNQDEAVVVALSIESSLMGGELQWEIESESVNIDAKSSKEVDVKFNAKLPAESFKLKIIAKCSKNCSDSFSVTSKIIGRGFPVLSTKSGFIGTQGNNFTTSSSLEFNLPGTYEQGTLDLKAKIYTSKLSSIVEALEKLIRDPHGCFEQTSSTTYPLVMALILMKNMPEKDGKITEMMIEGKQKLSEGYKRLLTFETKTGGYEWFGEAPGHEALTAYGLMQFNEMKEVLSDVDQGMIDRVTSWLLDKRDGKGSFAMSANGVDSFGKPPPDLSDAYILWVLTSIHNGADLEKEIKQVIEKAKATNDSYLTALVANILYNTGRDEEAKEFSRMLKSNQNETTGEVQRKVTSITRSMGASLNIETTALATLAWMKDKSGEFADATELGVKFIVSSVKEGAYGSTQGTILSLKVLVEFLKNSKLEGEGTFEVTLDDHFIYSIPFDQNSNTSSIDFSEHLSSYIQSNPSLFKKLTDHSLKLNLVNFSGNQDKFRLSYSLETKYRDMTPKSNANSDLKFTVTSSNESDDLKIGDISMYTVTLENKDQVNGKGMALAVIRIPSCQEVDYNSLERLQNQGKVAYFEVFNGNTDVVLYWRALEAGESKQVKIAMTQLYDSDLCIFRPSEAYLYYDVDGSQVWTE